MALADWDPRLITPERALHLAGDWPLTASLEVADLEQFEREGGGTEANRWQINLRCRKDMQSVGLLAAGVIDGLELDHGTATDQALPTSIGDLLSGVLRHLVMAHDVALSGAGDG